MPDLTTPARDTEPDIKEANSTVLAFTDTVAGNISSANPTFVMRCHIIRDVYCSKDIASATTDAGESANDLLLETFLDYDNYANDTGGQKICASMKDGGLRF